MSPRDDYDASIYEYRKYRRLINIGYLPHRAKRQTIEEQIRKRLPNREAVTFFWPPPKAPGKVHGEHGK